MLKLINYLFLSIFSLAILAGCNSSSSGDKPKINTYVPTNPDDAQQCLAIDTDGDGLRDCEDPDIDNDGRLNEDDLFPYDSLNWEDTDGDGVGDNTDWEPLNPLEWADSDSDGIGGNADPDDDNDGVPDLWDRFRIRSTEYFDIDYDSLGDNEDPDRDNDGTPDIFDDLPWINGAFDIDGDLISNDSDGDIDGDGTPNEADAFPWDVLEWADYDSDTIGNNADPDDDNDGLPDIWDAFPLNRSYTFDSDEDGVANEVDVFPYDPTEWLDSDNDGVGDNKDAFPNNPLEWADTDGDGIGDNTDPDIDNDGYANQLPTPEIQQVECYVPRNEPACLAVSGCVWTSQNRCAPRYSCIAGGNNSLCSDTGIPTLCKDIPNAQHSLITAASCNSDNGCEWNGSTCDQKDFFPLDKNEHLDNDLDGLGDNEDPDDDNDGFPDHWDDYSFDNRVFLDFDNDNLIDWELPIIAQDMLGNLTYNYARQIDPDSDNDGVPDVWDDLKWDFAEYYDIDGDGIGDNLDQDDDNDGYPDNADRFPYDPTEWLDSDNDGIGDNADQDDDNDGAPDAFDDLPFNRNGFSDMDGDLVPTEIDVDIDGDLYANNDLVCVGTPPADVICTYPTTEDKFIWDPTEWEDWDNDGLGDNEDPDDDNDGAPDYWDLVPRVDGWADMDFDGIPDYDSMGNPVDLDRDGDGWLNDEDLFPDDNKEWEDYDGDGVGDNVDPDWDNDGVPNSWDDLPYDGDGFDSYPTPPCSIVGIPMDKACAYWADNDGDGIINDLDIHTPNGINNESDLVIAISQGENISLTSDFSITTCYTITNNKQVNSNEEMHTLTYEGPDNGCMFNVTGDMVNFSNIKFIIPEGRRATIVRANPNAGLNFVSIFKNIFEFEGLGIISDFRSKGMMSVSRNHIFVNTHQDLGGTGYETIAKFAPATTGLVTSDEVGYMFGGNIVIWNVLANQTQPIFVARNTEGMRAVKNIYNTFIFKKADDVAMIPSPTAFMSTKVDFRENWDDNEYKGLAVFYNRANMNAGQFMHITSDYPIEQSDVNNLSNNIFGTITDLGSSIINDDLTSDQSGVCAIVESEANCLNNSQCTWDSVGGSCSWNGSYPKAYKIWYDFDVSDIFLAPERNDYSMFYLPNYEKLENSPAIFPEAFYFGEFDIFIIDSIDLGLGAVAYSGIFPPVMDSDADRFPDPIDLYPFDGTEWFDNDGDGVGNNADIDDDNDNVLDTAEKSYCQEETSAFGCNPKTGCEWDANSNSCKRVGLLCLVPGSLWDYNSLCCLKDGLCVDGTDPFQADTDGDGLNDYDEMYVYFTDPLNPDTDFDGDSDATEIANGTNPKDPLSSKDSDGDTLADSFEVATFSPMGCVSPHLNPDSDGDGLNDYLEYVVYGSNPCVVDTDGDGINDYNEVQNGTDPTNPDTDGDGLNDGQELVYGTDPLNSDSDGDGSPDGREIADGTNPLDANSFKDTDGDGESDYVDITPYGATPCSNTSLSTCTNTFSNSDLRTNLNLQIANALTCATRNNSATCIDPLFDLCKWNSGQSKCEAKDVVVFHDITVDQCYDIARPSNGNPNNLTIRARSNDRKTITVPNSVLSHSSCQQTAQNQQIFALGPNAGLKLEYLNFNIDSNVNVLVGDYNIANRGGYSFEASSVAFSSENRNGSSFVKLKNYAKVNLNKITLKQSFEDSPVDNTIKSLIDITYNAGFCGGLNQTQCEISTQICSWSSGSCVDKGISELSIQGMLANCDTSSYLSDIVTSSKDYSCIRTEAPTTTFAGNSIIMGESNSLGQSIIDNPSNATIAWRHTQGNGLFRMYLNRIFSRSKTIKVNNSSTNIVNANNVSCGSGEACSIGLKDGANRSNTAEWSGSNIPSFSGLSTISENYNNIFKNNNSYELACESGSPGFNEHPGYFEYLPSRTFWSLITSRTGCTESGSGCYVQITGALNTLCSP